MILRVRAGDSKALCDRAVGILLSEAAVKAAEATARMCGKWDQRLVAQRNALKEGVIDHRPVAPPDRRAEEDRVIAAQVGQLSRDGGPRVIPLFLE